MRKILLALGLGLGASLPAYADLDRHKELAITINQAASGLSRLWPGYWPVDQAYVLYDNDECWLVGDKAPLGAHAVEDAKLPPGLIGRSYTFPCDIGKHHDFALEHDWGGVTAPGVRTRPTGGGKPRRVGKQSLTVVDTLFHEQFHTFQHQHFRETEIGHVAVSALSASLVADKLMEKTLLVQALKAESEAQRRTVLQSYLSLRAARRDAMTPETRAVEDAWVRSEGTAQYMGDKATALVKGRPGSWRDELAIDFLQLEVDAFDSPLADTLFRWQAYGVGAAELRLLEHFGLDFPARIADGATPADLLLEALGQPLLPPAAIRKALEGSRLEKDTKKVAEELWENEQERHEAYAEFEEEPYKLILDAKASKGAYFEANGMISVDDKRTLVHKLIRFNEKTPHYELQVKKRPLLLEGGGEGRTRYQVALRAPAELEGCTLGGAGGECPAGTLLDVSGVRLELMAPSTVKVQDGRMEIRLE